MNTTIKSKVKSSSLGRMVGYDFCYISVILFLCSNLQSSRVFGAEYAKESYIFYYLIVYFALSVLYVNIRFFYEGSKFSNSQVQYYQLFDRTRTFNPRDICDIKVKHDGKHTLYSFYSKNGKKLPAFSCIIDDDDSPAMQFVNECLEGHCRIT